ncbi:MAG: thioredoxin-like domain-containing protein [Chthonomonadaceae bacterium]|nr:thioredoxin-like domain-containing protein [Chthonomonadaceae bacterium]
MDAPDFPATLEWLNTDRPLSLKDLRGKVVLLDFWTYCCINCIHIIPDLKRLEARYPNELVVIGVHSAKFQNEKDVENIRNAILRYEIEHPVINDKDFLVWNAYGAQAWPTLVLIDPAGKYVGYVSGEGHYELLDRTINRLIQEFGDRKLLNRKPMKFVLEKEGRPKSVLSYPGKIVADEASERLFFTDSNHNRVIVTSLNGAVQTVIGDGNIGLKDGSFATARFFRPQGLTYDAKQDLLYVADTENHAVRRVDLKAGTVTTLAGNGKQAMYPPVGGVGRQVALSSPWDLVLIGNTLYVAMAGTHQLWAIDVTTGKAAPYAGTGAENIVDGPLNRALLAQPSGIATDGRVLFFADSEVSAVRTADLSRSGEVKTLIGQGLFEFGDIDGAYPQARLQHPIGVAYHQGYVYVADTYNHKIKRVDPKTRVVQTVIGTGKRGMNDGKGKQASLNEPNGLVFAKGRWFIADTNNHLIRVYDPEKDEVTTLRLTGIEKLAQKSIPGFIGKEQRVAEQQIAPTASRLLLLIQLPGGTKFTPGAPFRVQAVSDQPESVTVGKFSIAEPTDMLAIPITPRQGKATITVNLSVNYCATDNTGLCYFKEVRLVVPVQVSPEGSSNPMVTCELR